MSSERRRLETRRDNEPLDVAGISGAAAVYITFIEHPARMQCGVELAATEFAPSYRGATVMQAGCAVVGLLSSLTAWLSGASFWWLVAPAGQCYLVYRNSDPAHQQAVAQPGTRSAVSRSRAATRTLGQSSRGKKRAKRSVTAVVAVLAGVFEVAMTARCLRIPCLERTVQSSSANLSASIGMSFAARCDKHSLSHVAVIFKLVGDESGDVSPRSHERSRLQFQ